MRAAMVILIVVISLTAVLVGCSQDDRPETEQNTSISQNTISSAAYEAECARGIENDSYPGSCGLYTDKDNNGFCDLGE